MFVWRSSLSCRPGGIRQMFIFSWLRTLLTPRTFHGDRSDRKKAQKWEEEREKPKAVGGSVHLHKPMFMGNPLIGTGAINGGEFSARLSEGIISKARGVQDTAKLDDENQATEEYIPSSPELSERGTNNNILRDKIIDHAKAGKRKLNFNEGGEDEARGVEPKVQNEEDDNASVNNVGKVPASRAAERNKSKEDPTVSDRMHDGRNSYHIPSKDGDGKDDDSQSASDNEELGDLEHAIVDLTQIAKELQQEPLSEWVADDVNVTQIFRRYQKEALVKASTRGLTWNDLYELFRLVLTPFLPIDSGGKSWVREPISQLLAGATSRDFILLKGGVYRFSGGQKRLSVWD
ncbi:LOW QUALITY PROTEIN: hypothetical protein BC936DRAFT_139182 [Jimgerdemannia flammicorona]|uniref:Uncharacterized protein n=1 Tax=Jimgerdemannia flammicorona TaxID=994334 RepID=A0A433DHZ8_9FUNG|nr:LOW QUALITY PROTEIN: hypothetical protein BC936DRAFT_139182 [Jimgerdemannia flammicorona]